MTFPLPAGLAWVERDEEGRAWVAELPALLDGCLRRWSLDAGEPYEDSHVGLVVPVATSDGADAVLKIQLPGRESEHEADALARWDGDGAVRLLDRDDERRALLVERCTPGTHLAAAGADVALDVLIGLLPRLWKPVGEPFPTLAAEAVWWRRGLRARWERAGRPFEEPLVDVAERLLDDLGGSQGQSVLLHQDLHADNVLAAGREPWLVIDPKPLAGERELGIAPIVRSYELGHSREHVHRRFRHLTSALGLDVDRALGWCIAQTVAWAFDGEGALPRHLETARWLLELS